MFAARRARLRFSMVSERLSVCFYTTESGDISGFYTFFTVQILTLVTGCNGRDAHLYMEQVLCLGLHYYDIIIAFCSASETSTFQVLNPAQALSQCT